MMCKWCSGELEVPIISFKDFPVYSSSVPIGELLDKNGECYKYDFEVSCCKSCGLIQQKVIPDMSIVYAYSKNEGIGEKWKNHYKAYSEFILQNQNGSDYLEIGGGNLKVADLLSDSGVESISIVEIDKESDNDRYTFYNGFFEDVEYDKKYDAIYSSHVFEHISAFDRHLNKVLTILNDNGYYYISLPNFELWVKNFYLNAFIQDHIVYPYRSNIINYLDKNFELVREGSFEDHSLFFAFKKRAKKIESKPLPQNNEQILKNYKDKINNLNKFLDTNISTTDRIYIFGSHIFAEIILALDSMKSRDVVGILDNSILKQDKYLYYYNLYVSSPKVLKDESSDTKVIVFAGAYEKEIIEQIKGINPDVNIISSEQFNKCKG